MDENTQVKFYKINNESLPDVVDSNSFYYTQDNNLYFGSKKLTNDEDVAAIENNIVDIQDNISDIQEDIANIKNEAFTNEGSLQVQITTINSTIENELKVGINTNKENIESTKTELRTEQNLLDAKIKTNSEKISKLEDEVNDEKSKTSANTTAINSISTEINNINSDMSNYINPNLLINGDFRVNQRGQTEYNNNNSTTYTVDRWLLTWGHLKVSSNGTVTHTSLGDWQGIRQVIEFPSRLAGKTITLSAMADSTGKKTLTLGLKKEGAMSGENLASASELASGARILTITTTLPNDLSDKDSLHVILYTPTANQSVTWYWAKLEVGSVATPFNPRLYAEEFALCQRYYQRWNFKAGSPLPIGIGRATGTISLNIPINEMRPYYSFKTEGTVNLVNEGKNGLTLTYSHLYQKMLRLFINNATGVEASKAYVISGETDGYFAIDAEMYT